MKRLLCLLAAALLCFSGCGTKQPDAISIDIYAVDGGQENITRSAKDVLPAENLPLLYVEHTVQANGSLFPEGVKVKSVSVDGNTLTVDFSKEIADVSETDFLFINELCALAASQGERQKGHKIAKVNVLCEGEQLPDFFQYPYLTHLVDSADQANFPIWMARLYFPERESGKLVREYRLFPEGSNPGQLIYDQLAAGTEDPAHKDNILPASAVLNGLWFEEDTFYLDFGAGLLTDCTPGRENQLVQALTACYSEFTYINQVQLSVDGSRDVTLGDFSLAQPLTVEEGYFDQPELYFHSDEE